MRSVTADLVARSGSCLFPFARVLLWLFLLRSFQKKKKRIELALIGRGCRVARRGSFSIFVSVRLVLFVL